MRRRFVGGMLVVVGLAISSRFGIAGEEPDKYAAALKLMGEKNYAEAVRLLRDFVKAAPSGQRQAEGELKLADCLTAAGMPIRACSTYEKFLKKRPDHTLESQLRMKIARCYEARGQFQRAIALYKEYMRKFPKEKNVRDLQYYVATLYEDILAQYPNALREYLDFMKQYPDDSRNGDIQQHAAYLYRHRLNKVREARDAYKELVVKYPKHPGAREAQSLVAYLSEDGGLRDYPRAVVEYQQYVKMFPTASDMRQKLLRIGYLYRERLRQYQNAVDAYEKAMKLKEEPEARYQRAYSIHRTGDQQKARDAFAEFVKRYPDASQVHSAMQHLWSRQWHLKQRDAAVATLEAIVKKFPESYGDYYELAHRYRDTKQYDKAIPAYLKVTELYPGWSGGDLCYYLGLCHMYKKDPAAAEKALLDQMSKQPNDKGIHTRALWELGTRVYPALKNDQKAAEALRDILLKYPDYQHWARWDYAITHIVNAYRRLKKLDGAVADLQKMIATHPTNEHVRYARAKIVEVYNEQKKFKEAVTLAETMIDPALGDPAGSWAQILLGDAYGGLGQVEKQLAAYACFQRLRQDSRYGFLHGWIDHRRRHVIPPILKALEGKSDNPSKLRRALCQHALGQLDKAQAGYEALQAAGAKGADGQKLRHLLSELFAVQDRTEKIATGELDDLTLEELYALGYTYRRQKKYTAALQAYQAAREKFPKLRLPLVCVADVLRDKREYEEAVATYLKVVERFPNEPDVEKFKRQAVNICHSQHLWRQPEKARELAEKFSAQTSPYWDRVLADSYLHEAPYDYEKSLKHYIAYYQHGKDIDVWHAGYNVVDGHMRAKRYQEAADFGMQWIRKHANNANAPAMLYRVGEAYRHMGQPKVALRVFMDLIKKYPKVYIVRETVHRCVDNIPGDHKIHVLQQYIQNNPTSYYLPEMYYRLGNVYFSEKKELDKALEAYQFVWTNYRERWAENMYCAYQAGEVLRTQKKPEEALKIYREMIDFFGGNAHWHVNVAWMRLLEDLQKKGDEAKMLAFARRVVQANLRRREAFNAQKVIAEAFVAKEDWVQAAIEYQKMLYAGPRNDSHTWDETSKLAIGKMDQSRFGEAGVLFGTLLELNKRIGEQRITVAERRLGDCLTQSGATMAAIDSSLPEAGLLWGNVFTEAGEHNLAFERYLENKQIFSEHQHKLSPEFIQVIVQKLIDMKEIADAIDISRRFLMRRSKDKYVAESAKARVQLLLGDCYYRDERYDIARDEYGTVVNLYPETGEALDARFRIGQALMAQRIYSQAEDVFAALVKNEAENIAMRAQLMLGILYHSQGDQERAGEQFKKALSMMPKHETADEIMYRLGTVYQEQRKYKEALDTLRLIGAYSKESKQFVEPGTVLRIRVSDKDLSLTKGSVDVPVQVVTSSGDEEKLLLTKSEAGAGLFVGGLDTELGEPMPNDRKLQLVGGDTITYGYDAEFAKDYIVDEKEGQKHVIKVAADAELKAASTEIKDEDEVGIDLEKLSTDPRRHQRLHRQEKYVKPGNFVYVQVTDADRDLTGDRDSLEMQVSATSGDEVVLELRETDNHTGIFQGKVETGNRPPDAFASDNAEGHDARFAIDGALEASKCWMGQMDGRVPKTLTVDLKDVHAVDKVVWNRGQGYDPEEDRAPLRYVLQVSSNRKEWQTVAAEPRNAAILTGIKVMWDPDTHHQNRYYGAHRMLEADGNVASRWLGRSGQNDWIIDLDLGEVRDISRTVLRHHNGSYEVREYSLYAEETPGEYPGEKREMAGWKKVYASEIFPHPKDDVAELKEVQARYLRVHVTNRFHSYPDIGEFEVYPTFDFTMEKPKEGIGATFTFDPVKARYMRMIIHEYHNDAPAIANVAVFARDKRIVPTDENVHALANNNILEISPGDEITAAYMDEKNIDPGEPKTYRESLEAVYYNGTLDAIRHHWYEDERGNRHVVDRVVRRLQPGDRFIVRIQDYDEDKTDGRDKIPFAVRSESGQELQLVAMETEPYSGVFTKEVDTCAADAKRPRAIPVRAGETLEASYIDVHNTDPGNKTARSALLTVPVPVPAQIRVVSEFPASAERGGAALVSLEEPLIIEVIDPDACLTSGDKVKVELETTGGDVATLECGIPYAESIEYYGGYYRRYGHHYKEVQEAFAAMDKGLFRGEIKLMLGDKDSPNFFVKAIGFGDELSIKRKRDEETEPVLNAMGTDLIQATYEDTILVQQKPATTTRKITARIISDGLIGIYDDEYENELDQVHIGEKLHIKVEDGDADVSGERDTADVILESTLGDSLKVALTESFTHSGTFTKAVVLTQAPKADPKNDQFEVDFGSKIVVRYVDKLSPESTKPEEKTVEAEVVVGCDGTLLSFGKKYPDKETAVETELRIAECYFHMGQKHLQLKDKETATAELGEGQRMLTELSAAFPDNKLMDEVLYLLANTTQERGEYADAIMMYKRITQDFPKSATSPEAQYKIALCYEKDGHFDEACEEYVRLAYKYPDSPLVSDSMIRIGLYFFNRKDYQTALSVFGKFVEKYSAHTSVEKVAFKMGLCFILNEDYLEGADHFKTFVERHPDSDLRPAALYWAGDAYLKGNDALHAYQMFKNVIWNYPESKWAKYARGRLTAPVFDRIAEQE